MKENNKKSYFSSLEEIFKNESNIFLINFNGMDCKEISDFRKELNKSNTKLKLVKNKIFKKIYDLNNIKYNIEDFVNQTAIIWNKNLDLVNMSKIIIKLNEKNKKFLIKSCYNNSKRIDINDIKILSNLSSIEELRKKIINKFNSRVFNLVNIINYGKNSIFNLLLSNNCKK